MAEKSTKWSASRIGVYADCPLKYKYTYVDKWCPEPEPLNPYAGKGTCFHETVEQYEPGMDHQKLHDILDKKIKEYEVNTKDFDEHKALDRFFIFWDHFIQPKLNQGYKLQKEYWTSGNIKGETFCGALDLYIYNDSKLEIYDYKSGRSPSASKYKNQVMLYAYLEGTKRGWTLDEIVKNVKVRLFFPLAETEAGMSEEDAMLSSVKELKFSKKDLQNSIEVYYSGNIDKIHETDWTKVGSSDAFVGYSCAFCPYCGSSRNSEGFGGCSETIKLGLSSPAGTSYVKK